MIIEIGKRYKRTSPMKDVSIFSIEGELSQKYHQDLAVDNGFVYEEITDTIKVTRSMAS